MLSNRSVVEPVTGEGGSAAIDRASAFASLAREQALGLFPDLAASYATLDDLRRQIAWRSAAARAAVLALATESILEHLRAADLRAPRARP